MLELLNERGHARLAFQLKVQLGAPTVTALVKEGLLEEGALAEHFPCRKSFSHCHRIVVPFTGPGPYDFVAQPPEPTHPGRTPCCESVPLIRNDIRTLRIHEQALLHRLAEWIPFTMEKGALGYSSEGLTRLGWQDGCGRAVLLARQVASRATIAALEQLESRGAALVLAPTRAHELPEAVLRRYSGPAGASPVRLLFLEDHLEMRENKLRFRQPRRIQLSWEDSADAGGPTPPRTTCLAWTRDGLSAATDSEYQNIHARLHRYDLVVDLSVPVLGSYPGSTRDGSVVNTVELSHAQAALLLELVQVKEKPVAAADLRHLLVPGRGLEQEMDELRRICGGRPSAGASVIRSHRDCTGEVTHFSFCPPRDFHFAILLPLDYLSDRGGDRGTDSN